MTKVYIGLCSNVGDTKKNIHQALELLEEKSTILKVSSLYDTAPWGIVNQNWFINCEVLIETTLTPKDLLVFCKEIEKKMQRVHTVRNGPRTIDVDIHFYDDMIMNTTELTIPHPRFHLRLCNLIPLEEIAPKLKHPKFSKTIHELTNELKKKEKNWEKDIKKRKKE